MRRRGLMFWILIIAILGAAAYFVLIYQNCEQIVSPKMAQFSDRVIERDGLNYYCQTYFQKIFGK